MTIASSEPGQFPAQSFSVDFNLEGQSNTTNVAYVAGTGVFPDTVVDLPIAPLTLNTSVVDDACSPLPNNTGSLADKIVLVRSGGCYLTDKHRNLVPFNPQYILFYNNDGPFEDPNTRTTPGVTVEFLTGLAHSSIWLIYRGHVCPFRSSSFFPEYTRFENHTLI